MTNLEATYESSPLLDIYFPITGQARQKKKKLIVAERLVINKRQWGGIGPCSKIGRNQYRSLTAQPKPRREGARILTRYSSLQTCRPSKNCQCERLATPSTRATMQGLRRARFRLTGPSSQNSCATPPPPSRVTQKRCYDVSQCFVFR